MNTFSTSMKQKLSEIIKKMALTPWLADQIYKSYKNV